MFRLANQEDLFNAGYYFFFGSAKGNGGLQARLLRHISMEKKKFWHIDYLRPYMVFCSSRFHNANKSRMRMVSENSRK